MTVRANTSPTELFTGVLNRNAFTKIADAAHEMRCSAGESICQIRDDFNNLPEVKALNSGTLEGDPAPKLNKSDKVFAFVVLSAAVVLLSILTIVV